MACEGKKWELTPPYLFFPQHFHIAPNHHIGMSLSVFLISFLTFVELNCENLFDCRHDSLKQDTEFLPEAPRHWTPYRYWRKLNNIAKGIISCGENNGDYTIPDLVALCEVENDTVMRDLTKRTLLRNANYEYLMTNSDDERGVDVALLYHKFSFSPIRHNQLRIPTATGMRPTRDILYVAGRIITDDTLHIFVLHAPSRRGGERKSRPHRLAVADIVCTAIDSIRESSADAHIIVAGDFNDYASDSALVRLCRNKSMVNVTSDARGSNGAKGTYRYKGKWGNLDHILISRPMHRLFNSSKINDLPFLTEEDKKYGGVKPRRSYNGYRFSNDGYSDHLPLVVRFRLNNERGNKKKPLRPAQDKNARHDN